MLPFLLWLAIGPGIGDAAPPLALTTQSGSFLVGVPAGHTTAVAFFATWCDPCRENLDDLQALRAAGLRFDVIVVAIEGDLPRVRAYFEKRPALADTVGFDPGARAAHRWGEDRLPTTFFVDRSGLVRHINRGHGAGFRARADRWLRAMQPAPAPTAAPTPAPASATPR